MIVAESGRLHREPILKRSDSGTMGKREEKVPPSARGPIRPNASATPGARINPPY